MFLVYNTSWVIIMNRTKGLKYYALVFGAALLGLIVYVLFQTITTDYTIDSQIIVYILVIPVVFTLFLFVFDRLFEAFMPNKFKVLSAKDKTEYDRFLDEVNSIINGKIELSLEDSRKLRDNEKFQKTLSQIFTIKKHGETEQLTYEYLQKKFKRNTNEFKIVSLVIETFKNN